MIEFGIYLISIIIITYSLIDSYKIKNWLTIKNIIILSSVILFILPLLDESTLWKDDEDFLFIIFTFFLGLLISFIIFKIDKNQKNENIHLFHLNEKWVTTISLVIFMYYIVNLIFLNINNIESIFELLTTDRTGAYLSNPLIDRSLFFLPIIATLTSVLIFYYWQNKKIKIGYSLWFLYLIYTILTSHTRFIILLIILMPFFYRNYYIKKVKLLIIIIFILFGAIFLSVSNYARTGINDPEKLLESFQIDNVILQINRASSGSTNIFYLFYSNGIEYEYFRQYIYYLPITFIPRQLWSGKPIVSYFWRVTEEITGRFPMTNNPVLTTTIVGEAYHQGGIISVLVLMTLYLSLLSLTIKVLQNFKYSGLLIIQIIIHIPMQMRGGLNSIFISYFTDIYPLIILLLLGVYKKNFKLNNKIVDENIRINE